MGDRGNIQVKQSDGSVFFYTHWRGSEMKPILAKALDRGRGRWGDDSYLARIIFCDLCQGQERDETSFGIATTPGDNEYPILVVDTEKRTVHEEADTREGFERLKLRTDSIKEPLAYETFIAAFKEVEEPAKA